MKFTYLFIAILYTSYLSSMTPSMTIENRHLCPHKETTADDSVSPTEPRQLDAYIIAAEQTWAPTTHDVGRFISEQALIHYGSAGKEIKIKYGNKSAPELNSEIVKYLKEELRASKENFFSLGEETSPQTYHDLAALINNDSFLKLVEYKAIEAALALQKISPFFLDKPST